MERSRKRNPATSIRWMETNILDYSSIVNNDIWHDRAVFHFLTEEMDILKYVSIASKSIVKHGYLILATFSELGPKKCSGLPVTQYSESKIKRLFENHFNIVECFEEVHKTPFDTNQNFIWVVLKRN